MRFLLKNKKKLNIICLKLHTKQINRLKCKKREYRGRNEKDLTEE